MALILAASQDFESSDRLTPALVPHGHQVVAAKTVQEAIRWLAEHRDRPELFIIDVGLRVFGGLEFLQQLRSSEKWKDVPVIVQTRSKECDIFEYCDASLMKPWTTTDLVRTVNIALAVQTKLFGKTAA